MNSVASTVLFVDDNESLLVSLKSFLEKEGYQVFGANSAVNAIKMMSNISPDVIISDLDMPDMTGIDLLNYLQEDPKRGHIPFIITSVHTDEEHIRNCRSNGCDDFLKKPFTPEDLIALVKGKLRSSRRRKTLTESQFEEFRKGVIEMLSHELKTPLVSIKTGAEILLDQDMNLSKEQSSKVLQNIKKGGDRLKKVVDDFLIIQQIDRGATKTTYEMTKSNSSIKSTLLRAIDNAKEYVDNEDSFNHLIKIVEPLADKNFTHSSSQVGDALLRLIINAIKFGKGETVEISTSNEVSCFRIKIKDRGIGINQDLINKLLLPFEQQDRAKLEQQGLGLGLPIANHLIQLNSGMLTIEPNRSSDGTTVLIEFKFEQ